MNTLIPSILFENENVLVINKPAGLLVHPDGKRDEYSLVDWVVKTRSDISGVGEALIIEHKGDKVTIDRPGIVHRLDRETSGVMILAKNQTAYECLKAQFQEHTVRKEYWAIVSGWTNERGIINAPIGRSARDIRIWTAGRGARGVMREAVTRYVTEKKFVNEKGEKFSLVKLFPETGRTHQLRVHMKSLQHAIIGDGLYAPSTLGQLGFNRVALHARYITFADLDGTEITVEAPVPDDFKKVTK